MKSAHVYKNSDTELEVLVQDVPIPKPEPHQILIEVVVSGTNPKDWKQPLRVPAADGTNSGDDIAGFVKELGSNVTEFRVGDRVAGLHQMRTPGGSFAEYALVPETTTFHLPKSTSFEEGATIPLAAMTAAVGIYCRLGLPEPWSTVSQARQDALAGGVLVYGASSAVGAYAVKLLMRSKIHPIICIAGRGTVYVEGLLDKSKGDTVIDYRDGNDKAVAEIREAIPKGQKLLYAFDAVSEKGSYQSIIQVLDPCGHFSTVLPTQGVPETVHKTLTTVGSVHGTPDDLSDFGYAWFRLLGLGLTQGWFSGHPYEVVPDGLNGVQIGLQNLQDGKASALKYVYRIGETKGIVRSSI